jgi:hypothetical protein
MAEGYSSVVKAESNFEREGGKEKSVRVSHVLSGEETLGSSESGN